MFYHVMWKVYNLDQTNHLIVTLYSILHEWTVKFCYQKLCSEMGVNSKLFIVHFISFCESLSIAIYVFSDLYFYEHIRKSRFYYRSNHCSHNNNCHINFPCKCPSTNHRRYHYNLNNRSSCILGLSANEKVYLGGKSILKGHLVKL